MSKDQKKALKSSKGLRHYLAACVANNPGAEIAGCSLEEWVKLHSRMTVKAYQKKQLAAGCWGGDIEIAACAVSWGVNVWVWRPTRDSFELTCRFTSPKSSRHVLHLLYREGTHYDVFRPDADELKAALAEAGALPLTPNPSPNPHPYPNPNPQPDPNPNPTPSRSGLSRRARSSARRPRRRRLRPRAQL